MVRSQARILALGSALLLLTQIDGSMVLSFATVILIGIIGLELLAWSEH